MRFAHFCLALFLTPSLYALQPDPHTPNLLQIGSGVYDIIHNPHTACLQIEYRSSIKSFPYLRPLLGLMGTDKASFYLFGGMAGDIFLGKGWVLTPSFAPGLYTKGKGKDLHFPLEFRSAMELSWAFPHKGRIGGQFYHISNASLGGKNPGAEALIFFYAIAL